MIQCQIAKEAKAALDQLACEIKYYDSKRRGFVRVGKLRVVAGLLVLLLLLSLFTGCKSSKGKEALANEELPKIKLNFYYPRDGSEIIKRLVTSYQTLHEDIILKSVEISGDREGYVGKLSAILAAGEEFPDVMIIHDSWVTQFAKEGYIKVLDGGLSDVKQAEYFTGMVQAMTWNKKIYGLPFWQDAPLLYYRKDLMASPPSTWDELERLAVDISAAKGIPNGLVFPANSQENSAAFIASLLTAYHAYPDLRASVVAFDEAPMVEAFNRLNSMVLNGAISNDVLNMSAEDSRITFEKGNSVFMWNWSYASKLLNNEDSLLYGKIGTAPIPMAQGGMNSAGILSGWAMVMSKQTKAIPEAWSFMEYLAGSESQLRIATEGGLMPAKSALYKGKDWQSQLGLSPILPDVLGFGRSLEFGPDVSNQLNIITKVAELAIGQTKDSSTTLMTYLKEGVVIENPVQGEQNILDEP